MYYVCASACDDECVLRVHVYAHVSVTYLYCVYRSACDESCLTLLFFPGLGSIVGQRQLLAVDTGLAVAPFQVFTEYIDRMPPPLVLLSAHINHSLFATIGLIIGFFTLPIYLLLFSLISVNLSRINLVLEKKIVRSEIESVSCYIIIFYLYILASTNLEILNALFMYISA